MKSRLVISAALLAAMSSAYAQPNAQHQTDDDDADIGGPEATSRIDIRIHDLVEAIVNLSPDLARAKTDRKVAALSAEAERRDQAWVMTASTTYSQNGIADHVEAPPYSVVEQDTIEGKVGLGRKLPTGGTVQFELGAQHQHTEYNILDTLQNQPMAMGSGSTPTTEDAFSITSHAQVQIKQPLVRGLGDVALANEHKADLAATEATAKAQLAAEDSLKDSITDYWELAYSVQEADIRLQAVDMAKKLEKVTHDQIRAGTASSTALSQVESDLFSRQGNFEKALIDIESKSMELRRKAGLDLNQRSTVLHPAEPYEIGEDEFDVNEVLQRAKTRNHKLAAILIEQKSAEVDVKVAADAAKPQVDLTATGALIGIGDTTADSLGGIGNADGYQVSIGLSVSWELSGAAKRAKEAAEARRHRLDIDQADAERQIETQTVLAVKQVNAARKRVGLSKKGEQASSDNVRAEREQYVAGRSTSFNVLQRQDQLINARISLARAVADYHIAVIGLQYLSGMLLDQYGVDVKPHAHR